MLPNSEIDVPSNSPIKTLPLELLQNIFQYYSCGGTDLPESLLFVCRHWHDAAISFPILWSNIDAVSLQIRPKWTVRFIRARCVRSYPLPLNLDLGVEAALDAVVDTPTLLDRCTSIHIRTTEQWRVVGSRLPRLKHLVLSWRIAEGNWDEIPTLQSLTLKGLGGIGDRWTVTLLKNIVQLEATYSWRLWIDMQHAAIFAPKLQVLHLNMLQLPLRESVLERLYFQHTSPRSIRERTFDQVAHLILRYSSINPMPAVRHPLPFFSVPCLIHLEILLYHPREINNLLTFDYPTVTRLTVTMFSNPHLAVANITEDPVDIQSLLDLMKRLPNLVNADFTVTSVIMDGLRAELRRNPLTLPLPIIIHNSTLPPCPMTS